MLFPGVERDVEEWLNMNNYVKVADGHREYGSCKNIHEFREMFDNDIHDRILFHRLDVGYSMFEIMLDNNIPWVHFRPKKEWRENAQVRIHNNIVSIRFDGDEDANVIKLENVQNVQEIYTHLKNSKKYAPGSWTYRHGRWTCDNYFEVIPKLETLQYLLDKNKPGLDFTDVTIEI